VRDESTPLLHSNVSASKSTSLSYIKVAQPSESERGGCDEHLIMLIMH